MNITQVQMPAIPLLGFQARTTNQQEMGPNGCLPGLWQTYFQSGLQSRPEVVQPNLIYALYTDYESDAAGEYSVVIGHETGREANESGSLEPELRAAVIPEARYAVFTTAAGPVYEVVLQAWREIWDYFERGPLKRAYTGDFELYDASRFNPDHAVVQIYIAVLED